MVRKPERDSNVNNLADACRETSRSASRRWMWALKMTVRTTVGAISLAGAGDASANPRPLPFTYPYETLAEGAAELELYGDMTPLRVNADPTDPAKGRLYEPGYTLQSELEYGVDDRWELGFYQVFEAVPQDGGSNAMQFDGFKFRVRTRLAESGQWPVDVSLYLELETLHDELGLEEKLNLQRRFDNLRWMANLWVEQSIARPLDGGTKSVDFTINPTTGFTYQVTPTVHPGVEYWARGVVGGT